MMKKWRKKGRIELEAFGSQGNGKESTLKKSLGGSTYPG
jgi:hypothetical protein